ncbi:organic cation/carnitine transporter, putative, partial [Ixodes scapularis]
LYKIVPGAMDVTSVIGDYGKFQRNIFMFCLLRGFPTGLHLVVYTFFFPAVEHWCAPPDELIGNVTVDQWKAMALPYETGIGGDIRYSSCFMFPVKRVGSELVALENITVACERWEYGETFYRHSLVQEGCDLSRTNYAFLKKDSLSCHLSGIHTCRYIFNKLGRRPLVIVSLALSLLGGLAVSVSPSFLFLLVSRSLVGLGLGLGQASCFCLLMEVVGPRKRTTTAVAFSLGFALGLCALPAFAWVFQDWRQLQVAISLPLVVFLAWSWYLPESPRWLVATGKLKRARRVLLQAGTANGIEIKNVDSIIEQLRRKITEVFDGPRTNVTKRRSGKVIVNCSDLLRTRKVRRYSIVLVYASMTCGAVFYGLQFSVTSLGGNPYINFLLAAAAEFPVCLLCYCTVRWCRRRLTMLVIFAVGGACSVAIGLLVFAGNKVKNM